MAKSELVLALEQLARERNIEKGDILKMIEEAVVSSLRKHVGKNAIIEASIDPDTAEFKAARDAGLSDAEVVEVITVVALNIFTNILGKATGIDIDFPKVELLAAPVRRAA